MKAGYKVENEASFSIFEKVILVSNYHSINVVTNLACMETSLLLNKPHGSNNVGMWKIKQLKSK